MCNEEPEFIKEIKIEIENFESRLTELETKMDIIELKEDVKLVKTVLDNYFGFLLKQYEFIENKETVDFLKIIQAFRNQLRGK